MLPVTAKCRSKRTLFGNALQQAAQVLTTGLVMTAVLWVILRASSGGRSVVVNVQTSAYSVPGGYYYLTKSTNRGRAHVEAMGPYAYDIDGESCLKTARKVPEPTSEAYKSTGRSVSTLPHGVPRSAFRWEGNISVEEFTRVPHVLVSSSCPHCSFTAKYKILNGRLYKHLAHKHTGEDVDAAEELLLLALYMFQIPDVDFILHFGDGSPNGYPVISYNMDRRYSKAGFTMPDRAGIYSSLGPQQFEALQACLGHRYSLYSGRIPQVVWRGLSTDPHTDRITRDNFHQVLRLRLHVLGHWYPDVLNVKVTDMVQSDADVRDSGWLPPLGDHLPVEDFNKYTAIVDVDGNGASTRFQHLLKFNTPILKQASNLTSWFEHLVVPGYHFQQFSPTAYDVLQAAMEMLTMSPSMTQKMVERQQDLARDLFNHQSVIEAMAYTLQVHADKASWTTLPEKGYVQVTRGRCCPTMALPQEVQELVRNTLPEEEEPLVDE